VANRRFDSHPDHPTYAGTSDASGLFSVPENPYVWHTPPADWGNCLYLVEVQRGSYLEYGWMPITDAEMACDLMLSRLR
jgi:hypothetical protein